MNIREYIEKKVNDSYDRAEKVFKKPIPRPTISYNLFDNSVLGRANQTKNILLINPDLLCLNETDAVGDTVPHEVAHLIVHQIFGPGMKAHGKEWKRVMKDIYKIQNPKAACKPGTYSEKARHTVRNYVYACGCRDHFLSEKTHSRIQSGQVAICKQCKGYVKEYKEKLDY